MKKKFTVTCEMHERWVPQFLGMLREMQRLGCVGSSQNICFFADGDGDFRPKFDWDETMVAAQPIGNKFDAG